MIHEDKEIVDEPRFQDSALKPIAMLMENSHVFLGHTMI